jgi:hypothetical protein
VLALLVLALLALLVLALLPQPQPQQLVQSVETSNHQWTPRRYLVERFH